MSERTYASKKILAEAAFQETALEITGILGKHGLPHALIGGLAVAYYANPPVTPDIDFLVDADDDDPGFFCAINHLKHLGWIPKKLWFPPRGPGFPQRMIGLHKSWASVDLILTSHDRYLSEAVARSQVVHVAPACRLLVALAEDIVVIKTLVGREKDLADVEEIVDAVPGLNVQYIEETLRGLMPQ